jgi:integrase
MRRDEMLALRWRDIDVDAAKLQVQQSLDETNDGLRLEASKTKYGCRTISFPPSW